VSEIGGTDSVALAGLLFGIGVAFAVFAIYCGLLIPIRLMRRFLDWAQPDE
jgi:hypothetical protein